MICGYFLFIGTTAAHFKLLWTVAAFSFSALFTPCPKNVTLSGNSLSSLPVSPMTEILNQNRIFLWNSHDFCCAMLCICHAYVVIRCLFVCHVRLFYQNEQTYLKIFSLSGSHIILAFPHHMLWQYFNEDPLMGASNAGGVGKHRDSRPISGFGIDDWWSVIISKVYLSRCWRWSPSSGACLWQQGSTSFLALDGLCRR